MREKQPGHLRMEKREKPVSTSAGEVFFWAQALAVALVVLVLVNTFVFRLSGVHGNSMNPTLQNGDQLILQVLGFQAQRGDIVVCISDTFQPREALVKRVIGLPGDMVDIDPDGYLIRNGETVYEPYIAALIESQKRGDQIYPVTVQPGHVFVMGDNRNGSTDSRWMTVGQIREEQIIGKAILRLWPLTQIGGLS